MSVGRGAERAQTHRQKRGARSEAPVLRRELGGSAVHIPHRQGSRALAVPPAVGKASERAGSRGSVGLPAGSLGVAPVPLRSLGETL